MNVYEIVNLANFILKTYILGIKGMGVFKSIRLINQIQIEYMYQILFLS